MGYECSYTLDWKLPEEVTDFEDMLKELKIEIPYDVTITQDKDEVGWKIVAYIEDNEHLSWRLSGEPTTWYSDQEDVAKMSAEFPNVLFTLDVEGRCDTYEKWRYYFKNGKSYRVYPTVIFPEFDEEKLK